MTDGPKPKTFGHNYQRYKRSMKEEDRIAEKLGGRRLPRSGGLGWSGEDPTTDGGDVTSEHLHVEHKRIEPKTKSVGIKRDWLAKVTEGARRRTKIPSMILSYENPEGHAQDWLLLPLDIATRLLNITLDPEEE